MIPSVGRPKALLCTTPDNFRLVYPPHVLDQLARRVDFERRSWTDAELRARPELLADVEFLFTTWKGPRLDAALLRAAPRLRGVFHAAGTVKAMVTPEFWARDIPLCNAQVVNGLPVADFAYAQILLGLKGYWRLSRGMRALRAYPPDKMSGPGIAGATVGLVSFGGIARALAAKLVADGIRVLAYDPFVDAGTAALAEVELVTLEEVFSLPEVVSCHAPLNPATRGLVTRELLASLRPGAVFLNTARGQVVAPGALEDVFGRRPDLTALLDVTDPEPLPADSPLWDLPNVITSPHIAGSTGRDCARMAESAIAELDRLLSGQPLRFAVTPEAVALAT